MGVSGKGDQELPAGPKVQSTCFVPKTEKGVPGQPAASWVLMLPTFTGECSLGETVSESCHQVPPRVEGLTKFPETSERRWHLAGPRGCVLGQAAKGGLRYPQLRVTAGEPQGPQAEGQAQRGHWC